MAREIFASAYGAIANDGIDDSDAINAAIEAANEMYLDDPSAGQVIIHLAAGEYIVSGNPSDKSDGAIRLLTGTSIQGAGLGITTLKVADGWDGNITGIVRTSFDEITTDASLFDVTLDGNRDSTTGKIDGFYTGVRPADTRQDADITVARVEIKDASGYGFDPHEQTIRLIIEDSVAHGNGLDGFVADFIVDGIYRNNIAYENDRHGFNITTSTINLLLENNIAYDNGGGGVVVQRGSEDIPWPSNIDIVGGEYYSNDREGILLKLADDVSITGAKIYDNVRQGIRVDGASNTLIEGNEIYNNSQFEDGRYDEIQIRRRDDSTTSETYFSTNTAIKDNQIYSDGLINARYGIREDSSNTEGGATGTTITGNTISGMDSGDISVPGFVEDPGPPPPPPPPSEFPPIIVGTTQAESLQLDVFAVENVSAANGDQVISTRLKTDEATAKGSFVGEDGTYNILINYFDENDGNSGIGVRKNGDVVATWVADADLGQAAAKSSNLVSYEFEVALVQFDELEIFAARNGNELVRIDSIVATFVDGPPDDPDNPVVANDDTYDAMEDETLVVDVASGVLLNDTAPDGGKVAVAGEITTTNGGTVVLAADGSFSYTPASGFFGEDQFTYTAADDDGDTDTATVTFTVGEKPEDPDNPVVANDDSYNGMEDEFLFVDASSGVLANDTAPDGGKAAVAGTISTSGGGTVELAADGSFTYTPEGGFFGDDQFEYTAFDLDGDSDTATVTIAVEETPDVLFPVLTAGETVQAEDLALTVFAVENVKAADGGQVIASRTKGVEASAKGSFVGDDGLYDLTIEYFDENDGASVFGVRVNDVVIDTWIAAEELGTAGASLKNLVSRKINGIDLASSDTIEVFATRDSGELVRVDSLFLEDSLILA